MFKQEYGPWCVILGGSEGIGAAFARDIAVRGVNLVLMARKPGPLDDLAAEIRAASPAVEVRTLSLDLANADAGTKVKAATAGLEVGLFIYNAGAETTFGDFLDHEWLHLHGRLMRNFVVKTELAHHFGRAMRARKHGGIILMGSIAGFFGSPGFALYGASKAFTHFLSEGLWYEFKQDNVDLLCPIVGPTDTPAMVTAYGPMEGHKTDPAFVSEGALARLKDGPIWVADDIVEQVNAISAKPPAERATIAAEMGQTFSKSRA
jgi:short-subunit dehydrogenase